MAYKKGKWSKADETVLIEVCLKKDILILSDEEILNIKKLKKLNRSPEAIKNKVSKLDLKTEKPKEVELEQEQEEIKTNITEDKILIEVPEGEAVIEEVLDITTKEDEKEQESFEEEIKIVEKIKNNITEKENNREYTPKSEEVQEKPLTFFEKLSRWFFQNGF